MSKTSMPYEQAYNLADEFIDVIRGAVVRAEIAGSLRRKKVEVGDIEVIAIAKTVPVLDMFQQPTGEAHSLLDDLLTELHFHVEKGKDKYKKIRLDQIDIDLWITTPECWGVNFTLRTGSADFSKWLVTPRNKGGALPSYLSVRDARVWSSKGPLDTPEEEDFFHLIGLPWVPPEERTEGRWFGKDTHHV